MTRFTPHYPTQLLFLNIPKPPTPGGRTDQITFFYSWSFNLIGYEYEVIFEGFELVDKVGHISGGKCLDMKFIWIDSKELYFSHCTFLNAVNNTYFLSYTKVF